MFRKEMGAFLRKMLKSVVWLGSARLPASWPLGGCLGDTERGSLSEHEM